MQYEKLHNSNPQRNIPKWAIRSRSRSKWRVCSLWNPSKKWTFVGLPRGMNAWVKNLHNYCSEAKAPGKTSEAWAQWAMTKEQPTTMKASPIHVFLFMSSQPLCKSVNQCFSCNSWPIHSLELMNYLPRIHSKALIIQYVTIDKWTIYSIYSEIISKFFKLVKADSNSCFINFETLSRPAVSKVSKLIKHELSCFNKYRKVVFFGSLTWSLTFNMKNASR